jgi:hypothetical protein
VDRHHSNYRHNQFYSYWSLLVYWQIKAQTKQIKSSTDAMIASQVDEINRLLFEHPEVFPVLDKPYPVAGLGEGDPRYHLMHLMLNNFEQVFRQHKQYGYIDSTRWDSWNTRIITAILKKPYAMGHWEAMGWQYPDDFKEFIEDLKREQLAPNNSLNPTPR